MPTAAYNKFNDFVEALGRGVHNFNAANALKVYLTNTSPVSTHNVKTDGTELAAMNGYTVGGIMTTSSWTEASGTATLANSDVTWTAGADWTAQFRYVVLYNDTATSPLVDPLIAWWDYGSAVTLLSGETFTVDYGSATLTIA